MSIKLLSSFLVLCLVGCGRETVPAGAGAPGGSAASSAPEAASSAADSTESKERVYHGFERERLCQLKLHKEWYETGVETRENYRAEVSTSYQHDGASAGQIVLKFSDSEGLKLAWEDEASGQYLRLELLSPADSIKSPSEFKIRWLHGKNHHHKNTCSQLR